MASAFYGKKIPGVKFPVFEQPLGESLDERFYSVDCNQWVKDRALGDVTVTSVNNDLLKVDNVSVSEGVVYFRLSGGVAGYQAIKLYLPVAGEDITRHYCVQVKPL